MEEEQCFFIYVVKLIMVWCLGLLRHVATAEEPCQKCQKSQRDKRPRAVAPRLPGGFFFCGTTGKGIDTIETR